MRKKLLLTLFCVAGAPVALAAENCQLKSLDEVLASKKSLDAYVTEAMQRTRTSAVSVAVIVNGTILPTWSYGAGVDELTPFQAGSLSKVASAFVALKEFKARRISHDFPLSYLVDEPFPDNKSQYLDEITLKTILNHTSGMGNKKHPDHRIYFKPGASFSYSGEAFTYLQQVLDKVAAVHFQTLMEKQYLPSWHMSHSSFHFFMNGQAVVWAAASWVSIPSDVAKLWIELVEPHPENEGVVALMTTPSVEVIPKRLSWGLGPGIYRCGDDTIFWQWGHNTAAGTFDSLALIDQKKKTGVVIMTAGEEGQSLLKEIAKLAVDAPDFGYWADVPELH